MTFLQWSSFRYVIISFRWFPKHQEHSTSHSFENTFKYKIISFWFIQFIPKIAFHHEYSTKNIPHLIHIGILLLNILSSHSSAPCSKIASHQDQFPSDCARNTETTSISLRLPWCLWPHWPPCLTWLPWPWLRT